MTEPTHRVLIGDCRESMRSLPAGSVHCCVTSPPYWALRDYGVDGQLGLEKTPDEYIAAMVDVFREVKRVLRDDGCLWVNIGDSYASRPPDTHGGFDGNNKKLNRCFNEESKIGMLSTGLKPKDLVGIPWRLAFALQADGWFLRQDIIWSKPAPMPESVRDRCTKSHEYIFLLTKRPRYFFDNEAVKESGSATCGNRREFRGGGAYTNGNAFNNSAAKDNKTRGNEKHAAGNRNRRSVWTINTEAFRGAHFATFPTKLVEPCILAGTSAAGCCGECGKPWERVVEKQFRGDGNPHGYEERKIVGNKMRLSGEQMRREHAARPNQQTGWRPTCPCGVPAVPCTVLDPFGGSGTTAGVALYHRRNAILCELNPEYAAMVPGRIDDVIRRMRKREAKRAERKQAKPLAGQKTLWSE